MGARNTGGARGALSHFAVAALLGAFAAPALSATLTVLADTDNNTATGCSMTTPDGAFGGVEARFITTVDTGQSPPRVTGITREDCASGAFGAPVSVSAGGWAVGVGLGESGADVIETGLPAGVPGPVRIGVIYSDGGIGSDAATLAPGGGPIVVLPAATGGPVPVPTLSDAALALLALLLVAVGWKYGRHRIAAPMAMVALAMVSLVAWAAIVLDGQVGDWAGIPQAASDPADVNGADIVAVFGTIEGTTLFVRVDARIGKPPVAAADSYTASSGSTLNVAAGTGVLANDGRGVPAASVASFGGGSVGGVVTTNAAGATASFGAGGSLTVNVDGSFAYTPATGFTGAFTFSYRITNLNGASDAVVTIDTRLAPAITSPSATSFNVGTPGTFTVTASGFPAPALSMAGALPAGVTFNAGTGVLSGTPAAGTGGNYPLTFTAANGVSPDATQSFTLTVTQGVTITSANAASFTAGQAGTFAVTTTASPTASTITFTGTLPAGVTFTNNADGTATIAGTPAAGTGGTYPITITAGNGGVSANGTQSFTLTVNQAPAITSGNATTFAAGLAGTFTVTATGFPAPAVSTAGPLPSGVSLTAAGALSGTPATGTGGVYAFVITAANGTPPNATQGFTLTVTDLPVAVNDGYGTVHDTALPVTAPGVLANDNRGVPLGNVISFGGGSLGGSVTTNAAGATVGFGTGGSLTVNPDGSFVFTPSAGFAGSFAFLYRVGNVDGTSDATVTITVTNALPVADLNGPAAGIDFAATFTEGAGAVGIVDAVQLTVTDADHAQLTGATIQITNLLDGPAETLAVTCPGVAPVCAGAINVADVTYAAGTGTLAILATAPLADFQMLLRTLTYHNASAKPDGTPRDVTVTIGDGIADNSPVARATVSVAGVNNAPVLAGVEGAPLAYGVSSPAAAITSSLTVSDADSADLTGATVQVTGNCAGADDVLGFTNQSGISGSYAPATCLMTLSGTSSVANYQAALRSVTYRNANPATSTATRTVSLQANDGQAVNNLSNVVTRGIAITVNGAPVVNAGGTLNYTENDAPTAIDATVAVVDADSPNLVGATVRITTNCASPEDVLAFTPQNGISGSYAGATCTMTLTGSSSVANYQAALRSVRYGNSSDAPGTAARTVTWQVNDGAAINNLSNTPASTINVAAVNDAPVLTAGATLNYTENDAASAIDTTITATDPDSTNLAAATVAITGNCQSGQDVLGFVSQAGITGSYVAASCTLTLSGNASLAAYQTALRAVTYANTSENPNTSARTVTWIASDGTVPSSGVTSTISVTAVNDAPVATTEVAPLDYVENGAAVVVTPAFTVTDSDSTTLAGATVQITGNCAVGRDVLGFVNQLGITGSYNSSTCRMTLTGAVPVASYQTAIRAVTFGSSSDNPGALRTVSIQVDDGAAANNLSNTATRNIAITPVNDPPTATALANLPAQAAIPITYPAGTLGGTDPDGTAVTVDTTPINVTNGTVTLNADGSFTFTPSPLASSASFQYRVTDSGNPLPAQSSAYATVSFTVSGPAIFFVKNPAVGSANCTLGNECLFATAITNIGASTNAIIFIGDASSHTAGTTLNSGGQVIGQGVTGAGFDTLFGIGTPAQGTLATRPAINQPRPTVTAASGTTLTLGSGNTLRGFNLANTGGAGLTGSSFGTLTMDAASINSSGQALDLTTGTLNATLDSVSSAGGTNNVNLNAVAGTSNLGSGALSGATGNGFNVVGGTGTVTYNGTIASGGARSVSIANKTAGTITLGGAITDTNTGIALTGNTGATIAFTGALTLSTGASTAFSATGGGTVTATGTTSTITTTTGTALNVSSTTIGAAGLRFRSISSSGAVNGIVLSSTGSSGALNVTGTGAAASGGTIQNTTGAGISVSNGTINLSWMLIRNTAGYGIFGSNLIGANTLAGSTITGFDNGGANSEDGVYFVNTGTTSGSLTVTNSTFSGGSAGNDGIFMQAQGSGNMTLTVSGSTFTGLYGDAVQVNGLTGATSTIRVTIQNSTFSSAVASTGIGGISLNPFGAVNLLADINNNTFTGVNNAVTTLGAIGITNGGTANADVTIRNNTIDNVAGGRGITITADGGTTDLLIDSNSVDNLGSTSKAAINVNFTNNSTLGTAATGNVIVSNNDIGQSGATAGNLWTSGSGTANAILLQSLNGSSMTAAITGNVVDANTTSIIEVVRLRAAASTGFGGGTINATVSGNDLQDTEATTHVEFDATAGTSTLGGTVNLSIAGNIVPGAGIGVIKLTENAAGTLNVTQASAAAVSAGNNGATVTVTGSPSYGAAAPPVPSTPSLP